MINLDGILNNDNDIKKDKGKCQGYTDTECSQCERLRVEIFENGYRICEKCYWNETTGEYEKPYV